MSTTCRRNTIILRKIVKELAKINFDNENRSLNISMHNLLRYMKIKAITTNVFR